MKEVLKTVPLYGLLAEFEHPEEVVAAAKKAYTEGYRKMDAYTPQPVEGLAEAIGFHHTRFPLLVLVGGIVGAIAGFSMQYWMSAVDYPVNIGGRPLNSWPAFVPIIFEMTVLVAALTAVLGMLGMNGLPMPYHPVFNAPNFELASRNRFFLCIEARDPKFDRGATRKFLESLGAHEVAELAQ